MGGSPAGYESFHLDYHSWLLTGQTAHASPFGTGGLYGEATALVGVVANNPYYDGSSGAVDAYDPTTVIGAALTAITNNHSALTSWGITGTWELIVPDVKDAFDAEFGTTEIAAQVDEFTDKRLIRMQNDRARLMNKYSLLGLMNSTLSVLSAGQLEIDHQRAIDEFEVGLRAQLEQSKLQAVAHTSELLIEIERQRRATQIQLVALELQARIGVIGANRQYIDDQTKYNKEFATWDMNVLAMAGQGLSAIAGASVIPAKPDPLMEAISTIASLAGPIVSIGMMLA